jgi:hypothetical protein
VYHFSTKVVHLSTVSLQKAIIRHLAEPGSGGLRALTPHPVLLVSEKAYCNNTDSEKPFRS